MRKKRNKDSAEQGPGDSWLITFSDLCTLLLTFFVLLLSMSSLNQRSFKMVFHTFQASSGVLHYIDREKISLPPDMVLEEITKTLQSVHIMDIRDLDEVRQELLADENFNFLVSSGNAVWIKRDDLDTLSLIFGDQLLFESGSAELKPSIYPALDKIGAFILSANYIAFVDGHTDSIPIRTEQFPSNRELSVARAYAVLNYLIERCKIPASKLAMGGYGSSHPLADNATSAGREMNRRVEIIMRKPS